MHCFLQTLELAMKMSARNKNRNGEKNVLGALEKEDLGAFLKAVEGGELMKDRRKKAQFHQLHKGGCCAEGTQKAG